MINTKNNKRLTITINKELLKLAQQLAKDSGTTLSKLFVDSFIYLLNNTLTDVKKGVK